MAQSLYGQILFVYFVYQGKSKEILESVARSLFTLMIKHYQLKSEYLARNLSLLKLALSRNELTNDSSGMNFDTMIFSSSCKASVVDEKRWF